MIVYAVKLINKRIQNSEGDYYKSNNCEFTSLIYNAKFFVSKSSAQNRLSILKEIYKNCSDFEFSVVEIEIKEK